MTRLTYFERRWPNTPLFQTIAQRWCADQSRLLLDLVWHGYDLLVQNDLAKVPFSAEDEAKEESLNFLLAVRIDQCKIGDEPFTISHQPPEQRKRKRGWGKSPQPDLGFALYENLGSIWPIEGKILHHDRDIQAYLQEVQDNFLTGRYATFSTEGAMVGYLLQGDSAQTFVCIGERLNLELKNHPNFLQRPHKISEHRRQNFQTPNSSSPFCCHHLILLVILEQTAPESSSATGTK